MKSLHWTLLGIAGLAGCFALYYDLTEASQAGARAEQSGSASASAFGTPSSALANGAAEYRANLAIAASRIDEENPLRSYQPTPGIPGALRWKKCTQKVFPRRLFRQRWPSGFHVVVD